MSVAIADKHLEEKKVVSSVAMTMVLVSFSMLFATFFLGYAAYRFTSPVWPPMGMERPPMPLLSTAFILLSSISFMFFESKKSLFNRNSFWLEVTFLLGICFVISQFLLWDNLKSNGIFASSGIFPSMIYAFTWTHIAHIALSLASLIYLWIRLYRNRKFDGLEIATESVGKFWHFLGIIWYIMFFLLFII